MKLIATFISIISALLTPAFSQKPDPNADWKTSYGDTRYNDKSAWNYESNADIEGKVTEITTSASLIIRCKRSCEVYFVPARYELVQEQSSIRVKFNDSPVKAFGVHRSDDYTALFFDAPMAVIKAIRDNGGYMTLEYSPYQKTSKTVKYGVWNLPPTILSRLTNIEGQQQAKAKRDVADKKKEQALWSACKASGDNNSKECQAYRDRE
jgi:hypothetical protein